MADDVVFQSSTPATPPAGVTIAADDVGGKLYQRVKLAWGVDGSASDASASAPLPVVQTGTLALPTGAATETTVAAILAKIIASPMTEATGAAILAKLIAAPATETTTAALLASLGAAADAAASGDGSAIAILKQLRTLYAGGLPASLGQKTKANSLAVTLASDQDALAVTGTFWQATQPVSGTVAATQSGTWNVTNISGTVSLPTGAATSAAQTTGNTSLSSIDGKTPALGQALAAASVPVVLPAAQITTLTPPAAITGYATETTLAAQSAKLPATLGQKTSANSLAVTLASDQSAVPVSGTFYQATQPVSGEVAAAAADSGNPLKIGGKAFTSAPTPATNATRVDAYFDEYGRLVVSDRDVETGLTIGTTGLRDRLVAPRYTVIADSLADGLAGFWTSTTASGGTTASSGGEGLIQSSTGPTGSAQLSSTIVPYFPGQVGWFNSAVRFNNTGTANNTRRIGVYTVSGTTPQDGFYYELSGTTLNAVIVKAGTPTATASTSWSRVVEAPFTLDTNYHSFEIRYTANTVWFYVDNVLRHRVSGTTASITATLNFPITIHSINTSGATNNLIAVRNCGIGRFGDPAQPVSETGLSAVNALAVGGGTPHDSVDSGNPLKMGGRAQASAPTAVADGDRVNAWLTPNGAQVVKEQRAATPTQASVAGSASSVTLLASNTARLGATIHNDSSAILYLKLGATASTSSFTVAMAANSYYEAPFGYTGIIDGIWASATGNARVTEVS